MKPHKKVDKSDSRGSSTTDGSEEFHLLDYERAKKAAAGMDALCLRKIFSRGKPAVEIIREGRDNRK